MRNFMQEVSVSWLNGAMRGFDSFRRSLQPTFPIHEDPPPTTSSEVLYEGGNLRLPYYRPVGKPLTPPLLLFYALIKRPFILDFHPGISIFANLTCMAIPIYLT